MSDSEAFKVFDKEGKGVISTSEMKTVLTSMGEKLSEEEVRRVSRGALRAGLTLVFAGRWYFAECGQGRQDPLGRVH